MIEIIDKIDEIQNIVLEEIKDMYILSISYHPRYGFGMIHFGPNHIEIGDIEKYENEEEIKVTQINLNFPEKTYFVYNGREKETESFLFCKESFFKDRKKIEEFR